MSGICFFRRFPGAARLISGGLFWLFASLVHAVPPVEVLALFKDRAMVRAPGGETYIRVGETSKTGVTLLSASSTQARVRYQGKEYTLGLTRRMGGTFREAESVTVTINPDSLGQYRIRGAINDRFVNFLIDTGASVVAMSASHARSLGLNYRIGRKGSVTTAQGVADSYFVTLEKVVVGGVTAHQVQAAVIEGDYPVDILLGMTFLDQVHMKQADGVMVLSQTR